MVDAYRPDMARACVHVTMQPLHMLRTQSERAPALEAAGFSAGMYAASVPYIVVL